MHIIETFHPPQIPIKIDKSQVKRNTNEGELEAIPEVPNHHNIPVRFEALEIRQRHRHSHLRKQINILCLTPLYP